MSIRAGRYERQVTGYRAFVPKPLPPDPPLRWDPDLLRALSEADLAVGRLDGLARSLPNPDLFVAMCVRREAVLSSRIEGSQSTLDDVLAFEVGAPRMMQPANITETVNCVRALNAGLRLLDELALSGRLIRAVHAELMAGVPGPERHPGRFRRSQNRIGPAGSTREDATFVPPAPDDMSEAFAALERFLHDDTQPPLVLAGLAHAQFEMIHPFVDGNGRVGRALIALLLAERNVLSRPLLYVSRFLEQNRREYDERLDAIRSDGDWEGWLRFFLVGVSVTADDAIRVTTAATELRDRHLRLAASENLGRYGAPLLELLAAQPLVTVKYAVERVGATPTTIGGLLDKMAAVGIVHEVTGRRRDRVYRYSPFLDLFTDDEPVAPAIARDPVALTAPGGGKTGAVSRPVREVVNEKARYDGRPLADWVPDVVTRLFERSAAQRIIVFGSVVRGDDGRDSDIDVMVVLPIVGRRHDVGTQLLRELRDLPVPVDVVVVDASSFEEEALLPGIVRVAVREGRAFEPAA